MDDKVKAMTALFAVQQTLCDMGAYDELRAMTTTHEAAEAAEVLIAWHKAHTGLYAPPTDRRVSPDRFLRFCGGSEAERIGYTWQFYANHLPGLFEETAWLDFKGTLDSTHKIKPTTGRDIPDLGRKTSVFLSTNFKNHANHAWLRWFVSGQEQRCMFISPIPLVQDGSPESAWYAAQETYYLTPSDTVEFLNRAIGEGVNVYDLDCLTNDLTPAILASLDKPYYQSIIGYAHPESHHSTTLKLSDKFISYWMDLHNITYSSARASSPVLLINAAPIKWGSVDMEQMQELLSNWRHQIVWRKASKDSWYVQAVAPYLDMDKVTFSAHNLNRHAYNLLMSDCTHYLEPSGVGTFSCLTDAHASGLDILVAPGERAAESEVMLNELLGLYPDAMNAYPFTV